MQKIILTQNKTALVDDNDFIWLSVFKWRHHSKGYATSRLGLMHRAILNAPAGLQVDHINGNRLDNQRHNLRLCTLSQNRMNRRLNANNTSGYKGVSWNKRDKRWVAHISDKGKRKSLGHFKVKEDAIRAYKSAALLFYGEFSTAS